MFEFLKKNQKSAMERRRFKRLDPEDNFFVEFRKEGSETLRLGEGRDISEGGLRFATSAPVRKGEQLSMILYFPRQFPGRRKIEGQATVRRTYFPGAKHRFRVACEFQPAEPSFHDAVMEYMDWSKNLEGSLVSCP